MHNAIAAILDEKIFNFREGFLASSRRMFFRLDGSPVHNGEFGGYREELVRTLVAQFVPERMAVDTGFVVTSGGRISTQCDVVIYDRTCTPFIRNADRQRFFPVESVCAIGEVKSILSFAEAKAALRKLAAVKGLRDVLHQPSYVHCAKEEGAGSPYQPETDELDQLVSFLVCEKLDFDIRQLLPGLMDCYVEELPHRPFCHRHNMLLSVTDGLGGYVLPNGVLYPFPSKSHVSISEGGAGVMRPQRLQNRWLQPAAQSIEHIRHFCSLLHTALAVVSVLFPDLARYIEASEDVAFLDFDQPPGWARSAAAPP